MPTDYVALEERFGAPISQSSIDDYFGDDYSDANDYVDLNSAIFPVDPEELY